MMICSFNYDSSMVSKIQKVVVRMMQLVDCPPVRLAR